MNFKERIENSFSTYAAMTIQHRAVVDARDFCKPAARMAFYSQFIDGIVYPKPHKKTHKSITSAMDHFYVHGDASMGDLLARQARKITMRYPIEDAVGNMGTYTVLDNFAAPRYTEMRLGELGVTMMDGIKKDAIDRWFDNYDNTDQFPSVLPSLGFYNIVNGSVGIATAISSSIPQFNLREVNEAMIKLLWNPEIDFDEIYCAPDFATGGTIINANEVKESLKNGTGRSCIIRGSVEYDEKENALRISEVPYNVATRNIKNQIGAMFEQGLAAGIARAEDSSEDIVDMTVWLSKGANPMKITKSLFKNTMLQYYFPINMTMLDHGTCPKVFGWREALNAHLEHEKEVRVRIYNFDLNKIKNRIHVIDGFFIAIANIEEVVKLIKGSSNKAEAKEKLCERFGFDEPQVEAILKLTLSRLCSLEIQSFNDEKTKLLDEAKRIEDILNSKELFYKEIEKDLRKIADKFGDSRRTRLMNLDYNKKDDDDDIEVIEEKELLIHYTNLGNIYTQESTTLLTSRRGTKGTKVKMGKNEVIVKTINDNNLTSLLAFTNKGKMYSIYTSDLPIGSRINVEQLYEFEEGEYITSLTTLARKNEIPYFIFITKDGMIKKTKATEYENKRGKSIKAINLKDGDEVINVLFVKDEKIGLLASNGNFIIIETDNISAVGRAAMGVKGIKLDDGCSVVDSRIVDKKYIVAAASSGLIKRTVVDEFGIATRGTKGKRIQKLEENDKTVKFSCVNEEDEIVIVSPGNINKIKVNEIRAVGRDCAGVTGSKNGIVDLI